MNLPIESVLFQDTQGARVLFFCPVCGTERYRRDCPCPRCEGREP